MVRVVAHEEVGRPVVGPILVYMMDHCMFRQRAAKRLFGDIHVFVNVSETVRARMVGHMKSNVACGILPTATAPVVVSSSPFVVANQETEVLTPANVSVLAIMRRYGRYPSATALTESVLS